MAQPTLLGWANSVRMTMTNDPGRELFQEHVQTHGFSFLDNYLNDILSGAKQDPLIELVKTPGRKKALSQKIKFATKLAQVSTAPLEELNELSKQERESSSVVNDSTQALLSAKQGSEVVPSPKTSQTTASAGTAPSDEADYPSPKQDHALVPTHSQPELSVIAEDDEAMDINGPLIRGAADPSPSGHARNQVLTVEAIETQTFPQDKRHSDHSKRTDSILPANVSATSPAVPAYSALNDQPTKGKEGSAGVDIIVPLRDVEASPISPKSIIHKGVLSTLPTLLEPVPLRKSMRSAKDLSLGNVMLGAATPGNTGAGKRTSWLMKAREVKAMEGIPKKLTVTPKPAATVVLSGAKRKSDDTIDSSNQGDEERLWKAMKTKKEETVPAKIASPKLPAAKPEALTETLERHNKDEILDLLKKTVQSLETRSEKPSNRLSGNTAIALAEARAQAEARIAERNHNSGIGETVGNLTGSEPEARSVTNSSKKLESSSRVSDLFPSEGKVKDKSKSPGKHSPSRVHVQNYMPKSPVSLEIGKHASTSTTPPHSPPPQISETIPVFNKPSPVFVPPVTSSTRPLPMPPSFPEANFGFPPLPAFTKPASMTLGISPRLISPVVNQSAAPRTQPNVEPTQSDNLFGDRGNTEAWVPSTQETECSSMFGSQPAVYGHQNALDDDDSWPLDTKASQGVHWPFSGFSKEDSMTWSTHPSPNHDVTSHSKGSGGHEETRSLKMKDAILLPSGLVYDMDIEQKDHDSDAKQKSKPNELTVSRTSPPESNIERGPFSTATASLQSQVELSSQSSKFSGSIGRKESEAKKATQLAGVLAKKEDDRKAARLKESENRRQIAMQRKAEEEKVKQQEQERKIKDEAERRKREREEQVEKKPLKSATAGGSLKKDEEITKKRKLEEKKQELKKQISFNKSGFRPTASKQVNALSSSTAYNASLSQSTASTSTLKLNEKPSRMPTAIPAKDKTKPSLKVPVDEEHVQPSQIIQTQMAARAKAAMQTEPLIPSENIELPEVNSEYSDSDDEGRARTFDPPGWAQSPELRQALEAQSTINPDDIFGEIRPLRMEELFKAKASRFRPRSSSANWSGADRLTVEEEREYARRMGFK